MKLIIQIPCLNEEAVLPRTLADLPRQVAGFDCVEWLVIDDGSTDDTVNVARSLGVNHIIRMSGHQGLAQAFMIGISSAIEAGADVIVNTDADNQYDSRDIPGLVQPILRGEADMVIGARPIQAIRHFSPAKRLFQRLGSGMVRRLSQTEVSDAPSGFRAFTRDAALRLNVFNNYSYTLETIIQAGLSNLRIASVPIRVNDPTRPSHLMKSNPSYIYHSALAMMNAYFIYKPMKIFGWLTLVFFIPGLILAVRYLAFMLMGHGVGHIQSVIAAAVLALCSVFMLAIGFVAHLMAMNRRVMEEIRYIARSRRFKKDGS